MITVDKEANSLVVRCQECHKLQVYRTPEDAGAAVCNHVCRET